MDIFCGNTKQRLNAARQANVQPLSLHNIHLEILLSDREFTLVLDHLTADAILNENLHIVVTDRNR